MCVCVEVVLCMVYAGKKLGVAFYEVETAHLHIMPDVEEGEDLTLMHRGLRQLSPLNSFQTSSNPDSPAPS